MSDYIRQNTVNMKFKNGESWAILSPIEQSIKAKIEAIGTPLRDWDIKINRGVLTGLNEAFIIDRSTRERLIAQDPKSAEIIRPILRGKDIKRNTYDFKDLYLITTHNGYEDTPAIDVTDYPAVKDWLDSEQWNNKQHLGTSSERLAARTDKGRTPYNLRDCKYMDDFSRQKIMFSRISGNEPCFALDDDGYMTNDTGYIITGDHLDYLLEQLTSDVIWFAFRRYYMGGGIEKEFKVNNLASLPIPLPDAQSIQLTDEEIKFISASVKP